MLMVGSFIEDYDQPRLQSSGSLWQYVYFADGNRPSD